MPINGIKELLHIKTVFKNTFENGFLQSLG